MDEEQKTPDYQAPEAEDVETAEGPSATAAGGTTSAGAG